MNDSLDLIPMRVAKIQRLASHLLGGLLFLGVSQAGLTAQAQELSQNPMSTAELVAPASDAGDRVTPEAVAEESTEDATTEAIAAKAIAEVSTRLVLSLSERRVRLYRDDHEVVSYPVAVGKAGWETPRGQFKIYQKVVNPTWRHPWNGSLVGPGPDNPLGYRWAGFLDRGSEAFGFHGTTNESLIGQAVSHGCVRMRNADIEALFEQIEVGTEVIVHH